VTCKLAVTALAIGSVVSVQTGNSWVHGPTVRSYDNNASGLEEKVNVQVGILMYGR